MSPQVISHSTFDLSNVKFSDLCKNKMGGKSVYISYDQNKKFILQLPKTRSPFGLSEFVDQSSGRSSYSVDVSLDNCEALQTQLRALDKAICKEIAKNSKAWLGKVHSEAVVTDALYKPIVRDPSDPKYSPTVKLKVLTDQKGNFVSRAFDHKRNEVSISALEKGQSVQAIAHISQIWIIDNKCGVSIRLEQAKLMKTNKLKAYAFLPESDDDDDEGEDEQEEEEFEEEFEEEQ
jgi:hypothetical protein